MYIYNRTLFLTSASFLICSNKSVFRLSFSSGGVRRIFKRNSPQNKFRVGVELIQPCCNLSNQNLDLKIDISLQNKISPAVFTPLSVKYWNLNSREDWSKLVQSKHFYILLCHCKFRSSNVWNISNFPN